MTMYLQYMTGTNPSGTWTDFDLAANGVAIRSILFSYSQANRLSFYVTAAEQTQPIPALAWVRLWDDVGTDEAGNPLSSTNVLFYGIVSTITPGEHSNQVLYTCMDPTYFAAKTVAVMSLPYQTQTGQVSNPATGAIPRLVYNVKNTSDDDYGLECAHDSTVGGIVTGILDYCAQPLSWLGIAGYHSADFTAMTFKPQEKMVWESITVRAAIEQVWRCEPRFRAFFHSGTRLWRFYQLNDPGVTPYVDLYLNATGLPSSTPNCPYPVIGAEISPSFEDCATAVSIYGPPNVGAADFYWDDTLTTLGSTNLQPLGSPIVLENYSDAMGMQTAETYNAWQIVDSTQRAGSRTLKDWTSVSTSQYDAYASRFPVFLVSWDYGTNWTPVKGVWLDFLNGICTFQAGCIPYKIITNNGLPAFLPSTQTIFPPNAVKLVWGPFQAPLQVRYPSSGFSGTAYTLNNCQNEYRLYDESLAIGKEFGTPVTSVTRLAQYSTLAQFLHSTRCDVIYTGNVILSGIDYQYCRLNKQVNILDAAGSTTGWEAMYAPVTDVEYTYGETPTTTLTFNANWLELYGEDPAQLRERLRIQTFTQYKHSDLYGLPMMSIQYGKPVTNMFGSTTPNVSGVTFNDPFVYVDKYGNSETGGIS